MSHKSCIQAIKKHVACYGGTVNVLHQSGKLSGSAGIPDLYIQLPKYHTAFWFEVKVGRDKLSKAQEAFIDRQLHCGSEASYGGLDRLIEIVGYVRRQANPNLPKRGD